MTSPSVPQAPPGAITEIERLGYTWSEVAQFDLEKFNLGELGHEKRVQVRDESHYAPKDAVARFSVQMSQSVFPPIVVTKDGWLIDGNTRVGAALKRNIKFFPAIIVDVEYAGRSTTSKTQATLRALARTLNGNHGTPLTAKEIRDGARDLIDLGWKSDQIARAIGLKPSSITQVRREIAAENKLAKVGLGTASGIKAGASLRALGSPDAMALNDVPFRKLAELAADASLNAGEITATAKELKQIGSDDGQVERLEALRVEHEDRIRERELTGRGKPPVSRQLLQRLGFVNNYLGKEHELLETNPDNFDKAVRAISTSIVVLTALLEMQRPSQENQKEDERKRS